MVVSGDEVSAVTGTSFPLQAVNLNLTKSEPFFGDLGYSLPIPWPSITTYGWWSEGPSYPTENVLITRRDPEYFATEYDRTVDCPKSTLMILSINLIVKTTHLMWGLHYRKFVKLKNRCFEK